VDAQQSDAAGGAGGPDGTGQDTAIVGLFSQFADPAVERQFMATILPDNRWRFLLVLGLTAALAGGGVLAHQIGLYSDVIGFQLWPAYVQLAISAVAAGLVWRSTRVRTIEITAIGFAIAYIAARCLASVFQPVLQDSSAAAIFGTIVLLYLGLPIRPTVLLPVMVIGSVAMVLAWLRQPGGLENITFAQMAEWCAAVNFVLATNVRMLRFSVRRQWAQSAVLRRMAALDGLTGIANRRAYETALQREWLRCQALSAPVSLLTLDIDFFKLLNDSLGYKAGDACLRELAIVLEAALDRPGQMLARTGGDEFVVLLPETSETEARSVARRVIGRLEQAGIAHPCSPLGAYVTASVGIATAHPAEGFAGWELTALADRLVYAAKREGRNRTRQESLGVAPPPAPAGRLDAAGRAISVGSAAIG